MKQSEDYVDIGGLFIARSMHAFIGRDVLAMVGIDAEQFWPGFAKLFQYFTPINRDLMQTRVGLQQRLDEWFQEHPVPIPQTPVYTAEYATFLKDIGYIQQPAKSTAAIQTENIDDEVACLAGPQLLAPLDNPRLLVNACNARWVSLYEALYSSDVITEDNDQERGPKLNRQRAKAVVLYTKQLLDKLFPLVKGNHADVTGWYIDAGRLYARLQSGQIVTLQNADALRGYRGTPTHLSSLLLIHHNLHVEFKIDHESPLGRDDPAGIDDVIFESAPTAVMDCEDSVVCVDVEDKLAIYRNWLQLMRGTLSAPVMGPEGERTRRMNGDRHYQSLAGEPLILPGRSLLLIRNVGIHTLTDIVRDSDGNPMPEGLLDAVVTSAIGMHDIQKQAAFQNSRKGSIYIVKPKLHGADEVRFTDQMLAAVEALLKLPKNTIKLGIMDEEKRTSLNLGACLSVANQRVFMINTGFWDRTADEIHSAMRAGIFDCKNDLKSRSWFRAYEDNNVFNALHCGFSGRAQIGKGMWDLPEHMAAMLASKRAQLESGATTAWVPSAMAAAIHTMHYHQVAVWEVHKRLTTTGNRVDLQSMLKLPLVERQTLSEEQIEEELQNNAHSILGYVTQWINHGVGCCEVPNIFGVPLMEDRATLRLSRQHISNWLFYGVCSKQRVENTFSAVAKLMAEQNGSDRILDITAANEESVGQLPLQAALELVLENGTLPGGYTDDILCHYRRLRKLELMS